MNCPHCGTKMEQGHLHTEKYPFWTQQELRFFRAPSDVVEIGPLGDDTTSVFTRDPFPTFRDAYLCRACGMVAFSANLIEKKQKKKV